MKHEQMDITYDRQVTIVTLRGQFIGGDETDAVREALLVESEKANNRIVVNMSDVGYVNSSFIGVLLAAHAQVVRLGGTMVLAAMNEAVRNVFTLTKLHLTFPLFDSVPVALQNMAGTEP
jgi:anti-sigma B factor antagonist